MAVRSVRVKRTVVIDKINDHIKAINDNYKARLAQFKIDEAAYPALEAQYKTDLAAYYRRVADALDGTSKERVTVSGGTMSYSVTLYAAGKNGKMIEQPKRVEKPSKPVDPNDNRFRDWYTLQYLNQQKALLAVSEDEVISVGIDEHGALFTSPLGELQV